MSLVVAPLVIWLALMLIGIACGGGSDLTSDDSDGCGDGGGD